MDADRFATGLTYDQFKDGMTRNREAIGQIEDGVRLDPHDLAHFRSLEPLRVMAIVEDWCSDVVNGLPVVASLAEAASPSLDLRCFPRDQNRDLIRPYLNGGRFESVPVFAFFDQQWREIGVVVERPAAVTDRRGEDLVAIYAEHPEFASLEPSPRAMPAELYARLRALLNERRRGWRSWADRQLVLALRDATARANRSVAAAPMPVVAAKRTAAAMDGQDPGGVAPVIRVMYCSECGYEPQALALTEALLGQDRAAFASIELVPWIGGSFEVWIGDALVHSMERDGGFPDAVTLIEALPVAV